MQPLSGNDSQFQTTGMTVSRVLIRGAYSNKPKELHANTYPTADRTSLHVSNHCLEGAVEKFSQSIDDMLRGSVCQSPEDCKHL